jgi:hypothetical protein
MENGGARTVTSRAIPSIEGIAQTKREFCVTALITDTEQPLILGSEVINQQNIVFNPQMRCAPFFQGEPHAMIVDMVPWDEIKDRLVTSTIIRSSTKLTESSVMDKIVVLLKHFKIHNTPLELAKISKNTVDYLIEEMQKKPKEVLKCIKKPYVRWMILA